MTRKQYACWIAIWIFVVGSVLVLVCGCESSHVNKYTEDTNALYANAERTYGPRGNWTVAQNNAIALSANDMITQMHEDHTDQSYIPHTYVHPSYGSSVPQNVWVRRLGQPDELVTIGSAY